MKHNVPKKNKKSTMNIRACEYEVGMALWRWLCGFQVALPGRYSYKRVKGRSRTARPFTHKNPMQPASHRDSHTRPDSAQTPHTTSIATKSAPYTRLITTSALVLQSQHRIMRVGSDMHTGDSRYVPLYKEFHAIANGWTGTELRPRRLWRMRLRQRLLRTLRQWSS